MSGQQETSTLRPPGTYAARLEDEPNAEETILGRQVKAESLVELLRPHFASHTIRKALSIGSGYCVLEDRFKEKLIPDAELTCTDVRTYALAHFEHSGLTKKTMSATELDFEEGSFDLILAHQVLEHINAYPAVLDRMRALCRPGGLIYINVPNPVSPIMGKAPSGKWPRPLLRAFVEHNLKKFKRDFLTNTEAYHTGFTVKTLRRRLPDFSVRDLRKDRLKQESRWAFAHAVIDLVPSCLLFLVVPTNAWVLIKNR